MSTDKGSPSEVAEVVAVQLGKATVQSSDRLIEDLGAESADLLNLATAIEDRFGVFVDEDALAALRTVDDLERFVEAASR